MDPTTPLPTTVFAPFVGPKHYAGSTDRSLSNEPRSDWGLGVSWCDWERAVPTVPSFVPTTKPNQVLPIVRAAPESLAGQASVALGSISSYSVQVVESSFHKYS